MSFSKSPKMPKSVPGTVPRPICPRAVGPWCVGSRAWLGGKACAKAVEFRLHAFLQVCLFCDSFLRGGPGSFPLVRLSFRVFVWPCVRVLYFLVLLATTLNSRFAVSMQGRSLPGRRGPPQASFGFPKNKIDAAFNSASIGEISACNS